MQQKARAAALLPFGVFIALFLGTSFLSNNFYSVSMMVPFLGAALFAIFSTRGVTMQERIDIFCKGAGDANIIIMSLIFVLAGAFSALASQIGAVDATVNLGLSVLPHNLLITGLFIIACFISFAIGTSMGTIVALVPIALGIAEKSGSPIALAVGSVVGGAMFGDNLSMISDTTIAATRTQGAELRDKFRMNFKVVLPAAILTSVILLFSSSTGLEVAAQTESYEIAKVLPYVVVLAAALLGSNVVVVLTLGIISAAAIGLIDGSLTYVSMMKSMSDGMMGMAELVIIALLIGGMVEIIRHNGGIDYLINLIGKRVKSQKGAELGIASLVSAVDVCTANNTIAIVACGPIAKNISDKYGLKPKRVAGIMDMFSCSVQGIIPYGAQLLAASTAASITPFEIMKYLYYPYLMGVAALMAILFYKKKKEKSAAPGSTSVHEKCDALV